MQERLEAYGRTGEACPRCARPIRRIVVGGRATHFCSWCQRLPAADRAGAAAILAAARAPRTRGRRWVELPGEGTLGLTPAEAEQAAARARAERTPGRRTRRARAPGRRAPARCRPAPAPGAGGLTMSLVRLSGVTREIGTFVILDAVNAAVAVGERIGLVGPNGAGKTTLLRIVAGQDEPDRGEVQRRRALTIGLLAQEAHFDEAFASAPDLRTAVRRGAAAVEALEAELRALEEAGEAGTARYAELAGRFAALDG